MLEHTVHTMITYRLCRVQLESFISITYCFFPIFYYQCRISERRQQRKLRIFFLQLDGFHNEIRAFNTYSMSMQYWHFLQQRFLGSI